jgi:hypothetical protein
MVNGMRLIFMSAAFRIMAVRLKVPLSKRTGSLVSHIALCLRTTPVENFCFTAIRHSRPTGGVEPFLHRIASIMSCAEYCTVSAAARRCYTKRRLTLPFSFV